MERDKQDKRNEIEYRDLVGLFRNVRGRQIRLLFFSLIQISLSLTFAYQIQNLVDLIQRGGSWSSVGRFFILMGVLGVLTLVTGIWQQWKWNQLTYDLINQMRGMMYSRLLKKDAFFFDTKTTGDIASAVMQDGSAIAESAGVTVLSFFTNLFQILVIIAVLSMKNLLLGGVEILVGGLYFLSVNRINRKMRTNAHVMSQETADLNQHIIEDTKAVFEIKALNEMAFFIEKFKRQVWDRYFAAAKKVIQVQVTAFAANSFISILFPMFMVLLCSLVAGRGGMSLGTVVLFYIYTMELVKPLNSMADFYRSSQMTVGAADRVAEYLFDQEEREEKIQSIPQAEETVLDLDIQEFGWEGKPGIIRNLHRQFHSGDLVFLHGESGGGKTTLLKLICGFYPVTKGSVRINGTDVYQAREEDRFSAIKIQFQEPVVLEGTIRENVTLGDPFTDSQVMEALEFASLGGFAKPGGLDYELFEAGKNLSGGQKQRLALARIFIRKPRILILDEATSALDEENEALIVEHVKEFVERNHCILIATSHREAFRRICREELFLRTEHQGRRKK